MSWETKHLISLGRTLRKIEIRNQKIISISLYSWSSNSKLRMACDEPTSAFKYEKKWGGQCNTPKVNPSSLDPWIAI